MPTLTRNCKRPRLDTRRGWQFFLNPALSWADVSPETKLRLRTLPQETVSPYHRIPSYTNNRSSLNPSAPACRPTPDSCNTHVLVCSQ